MATELGNRGDTDSVAAGDTPDHEFDAPLHFRHRACQPCARSKLRCEWPANPTGKACIRCTKMNTVCELPGNAPRKRRGPSTRTRKLEDRLEGIMSLLSAGDWNRERAPAPGVQQVETRPVGSPPANVERPVRSEPNSHSSTISSTPNPFDEATVTQSQTESIEVVPGFVLELSKADAVLNVYRKSHSTQFPFVPIPITATASELDQGSPFLLRTILQIAVPQAAVAGKGVDVWFRQQIAQRVIVDQERRLELLQALLLFIAWGDFHFYVESQATDLLHMASALVLDLGLHEPLNHYGYGSGRQSFLPDAARKAKGVARPGHTLDDMRAMLGFLYLNSVVSTLFQRTPTFPYTSYPSHCCDILLSTQEYPSDNFLVALVNMQRPLARLSGAHPDPDSEGVLRSMDGPVHMVTSAARKELDSVVRSQPPDVQRNVLLWIHYHGILMRLYEPALHMRTTPPCHDPWKSTVRTEALSRCLQASVDFFAAYTSIPLDHLGHMPLGPTAYMAFAFVTASQLMMRNDADWDVRLARRRFDFAAACQNLADRFSQADDVAETLGRRRRKFNDDDDKSVLAVYSMKVKWIRQWYLTKVSAANASVGNDMEVDDELPLPHAPAQGTASSFLVPQELDEDFWSALLDPNGHDVLAGPPT